MSVKKVFIFFVVLLSLLAVGLFWWREASGPTTGVSEATRVVILKGTSAIQVADDLFEKGLIKDPLAFKFFVQLTGRAKKIRAGAYKISPNLTLYQIVNQLSDGPAQVWVTIPEGLRREQIVERFITGLEKDGEEAILFKEEFLFLTEDQEGYLFPDTYLFEKSSDASLVVSTMRKTFDKKMEDKTSLVAESDFTIDELVILASIIERETRTDEERPVVAGILMNRLSIGMALQADATVQYAVANLRCGLKTQCDWWQPVASGDLQVNSKYNTYRFPGLLPAPISNPGLSSIEAALSPADTPYFYYIHDSEGKIHFAVSLEEHNANVRRYLR